MEAQSHEERLLLGALQCLRAKGYASTTARDIAAASGVSLGSIGYHFGSKDGLLQEAIGLGFREWTRYVAPRVLAVADAPPLDRLRLALDETVASFQEQRGLLYAFVEALPPAARSPELRERFAKQYRDSRDQLVAVLGDGAESSDIDLRTVASLIIALLDGIIIQWLLEPEETPTGSEVAETLAAALRLANLPS